MTSWAGSESTADGQRQRKRGRKVEVAEEFRWRWGRGMLVALPWFTMLSWEGPGAPEWPSLFPPERACKWRGRAVIIYSLQLLTLDWELITAEGKSDRTWRVPEPVTLISVRCLQQEVREEELAFVSFHCGSALACCLYTDVCMCFFGPGGEEQLRTRLDE